MAPGDEEEKEDWWVDPSTAWVLGRRASPRGRWSRLLGAFRFRSVGLAGAVLVLAGLSFPWVGEGFYAYGLLELAGAAEALRAPEAAWVGPLVFAAVVAGSLLAIVHPAGPVATAVPLVGFFLWTSARDVDGAAVGFTMSFLGAIHWVCDLAWVRWLAGKPVPDAPHDELAPHFTIARDPLRPTRSSPATTAPGSGPGRTTSTRSTARSTTPLQDTP